MKKYLILLIIPLLFFSTGCEEDEDLSEVTTGDITDSLSLDPELFGVWCTTEPDMYDYYDWNYGYDYSFFDCHSFSSNGRYFGFDYYPTPETIQVSLFSGSDRDGSWWVQDGHLYLTPNFDSWDEESYYYNISVNELTLDGGHGEDQVYIKQ